MSFRINTNVNALTSHANAVGNNRMLAGALGRLSSGLRIQSAADDASGLAIADSLRSQASALGQAIANGNDAIGIIQTADKAMDEQLKILDTIKVKAVQAAQDGQSDDSRKALQSDIVRLMEELDNIANTTSFNGLQLLSGTFTNKEFQIGAFSNEVVKTSIGATSSDKIGLTRFETGANITAAANVQLTFKQVDGVNDVALQSVKISTSAGTGIGVLAETINKNSQQTGVRASYVVQENGTKEIVTGIIKDLVFTVGDHKFKLGNVEVTKAGDSNNALVNAINAVRETTGVVASVNVEGKLVLNSNDGRGIKLSGTGLSDVAGIGKDGKVEQYGRLSLVRLNARDIVVSGGASGFKGADAVGFVDGKVAERTVSLRETKGSINKDSASAMGFNANLNLGSVLSSVRTAGVTTLRGAMAVMNIAETAIKSLDNIRSDLGSVQNQLIVTVNNISVTQVNVKAAESTIRDVDFASESANFAKFNILAQSGSYAMSQANAVQQNVLRLLQ